MFPSPLSNSLHTPECYSLLHQRRRPAAPSSGVAAEGGGGGRVAEFRGLAQRWCVDDAHPSISPAEGVAKFRGLGSGGAWMTQSRIHLVHRKAQRRYVDGGASRSSSSPRGRSFQRRIYGESSRWNSKACC